MSDVSADTVIATGSSQTYSLADRQPIRIIDFASIATDATSAITQAVAYAAGLGGGTIEFPQGTLNLSSTILIGNSNIHLVGVGSQNVHDLGTTPWGTRVLWTGSAGGTMFKFWSPAGASNLIQRGGGIKGIALDGNTGANVAGVGLHVRSWRSAIFEDFFTQEFSSRHIIFDTLAGGDLGEARDTQENEIRNYNFVERHSNGSVIYFHGTDAGGGWGQANTSCNYMSNIRGSFVGNVSGKAAIDMDFQDNNYFRDTIINCLGDAIVVRGGTAFVYAGSSTVFDHVFTDGNIKVLGTESNTYPAADISFLNLDNGSGTPDPTFGTGATGGYSRIGQPIVHIGMERNGEYRPAADTIAWSTANAERVRINSAGLVGFGTNNPIYDHHIQKSKPADAVRFVLENTSSSANSDSRFCMAAKNGDSEGIFTNQTTGIDWWYGNDSSDGDSFVISYAAPLGSNNKFKINGTNGQITAIGVNGNTTANAANVNVDLSGNLKKSSSSLRFKTDVKPYEKGLNEVLAIQAISYLGINDGEKRYCGVAAEDIAHLGMEELIGRDDQGRPDQVYYPHMVALLLNAVKELNYKIDELKKLN